MPIDDSRVKAIALIFISCLAFASQATGASFEVRRVHPNNDAVVALQAPDTDLRQYDKWIWKWGKRTEDVWVSKQVDIDIRDCVVAQPRFPPSPALPMVDLVLTDAGRKKLADLSSQHMKKRVALVLDGRLLSVPVIIEPMMSGKMSFIGGEDREEAQKITDRINALINEARAHRD